MSAAGAILDVGLLNGLLFAWAVVGLAVAFRLLHFPDVTVEGSFPLGAAVYAVATRSGMSLATSLALAASAGAMAGAATGILHAWFRINKFLAGIIIVSINYSVMLRIMHGPNIGLLSDVNILDNARGLLIVDRIHFGLIGLLALAIGAGCSVIIAVLRSKFGMRLRAVGSNPFYSRSIGINAPLYLVAGLAITNALAALSGAALAMNQGFADISLGQGVLVLCLAAMTLGEVILSKRFIRNYVVFVVTAGLFGSLMFQCLTVFVLRLGVSAADLKLTTGILVLVLVATKLTTDRSVVMGREFD